MKLYIISFLQLFLYISLSSGGPINEAEMGLRNLCKAEYDVDLDLVERAEKGDFVPDRLLQCYFMCTFIHMGVMKDDGMIDSEQLIAIWSRPKIEEASVAIRKCQTQVGADRCETSYLTLQCYQKNAPGAFFAI